MNGKDIDDSESVSYISSDTMKISKRSEEECDMIPVPTRLIQVFGIMLSSNVLNGTTESLTYVYYFSGHAVICLDYKTRKMQCMLGHVNVVKNLAHSKGLQGKWLASADSGKNNTIIVWDVEERLPILTIVRPHGDYNVQRLQLSHNAKFLVSIGDEPKPIIKFWLWTYGKKEEETSLIITKYYGNVVDICFNKYCQTHFLITFDHQVVFISYDDESNSLSSVAPAIRVKKCMGNMVATVYIDNCNECVTALSSGCVILWGDAIYKTNFDPHCINNDKIFLKMIKVQSTPITTIVSVDGLIATGDVQGNIKFYDNSMKILYWCHKFKLNPIVGLSFNLDEKNYVLKNPYSRLSEAEFNDTIDDRSEEYEKVLTDKVPSDATLDRKPFLVRDFMIFTNDGQLGYVNFLKGSYEILVKKADSQVTCIEVHDDKYFLLIGYGNGNLVIYNYISCMHVLSQNLRSVKNEEEYISAIAYSVNGLYLVCGTSQGYFWQLEPVTLDSKTYKPLRLGTKSIQCLKYSPDGEYLACYDKGMTVYLFHNEVDEFVNIGRLRAHSGQIVDMLFVPQGPPRLLTIGEDRRLIEYDVKNCMFSEKLDILRNSIIDQTPIPRCMVYWRNMQAEVFEDYFMYADDQYKFKLMVDGDELECRKTVLSPILDMPIRRAKIFEQNQLLLFYAGKYFGMQTLPVDGNPYKYAAMLVHPNGIRNGLPNPTGKYLFIAGNDDNCCYVWKLKLPANGLAEPKGGKELDPFYNLIEGGRDGWLFNEIQDLFYYMQILSEGMNSTKTRKSSDTIPLSQMSNMVRACGFYPSEFELGLLEREASHEYGKNNEEDPEIPYAAFIKLYVNHKPPIGITFGMLKDAFNRFATNGSITREHFVKLLTMKGEKMSFKQVHKCFSVLLHHDETSEGSGRPSFDMLPANISYQFFLDTILGINLLKQKKIKKVHVAFEEERDKEKDSATK